MVEMDLVCTPQGVRGWSESDEAQWVRFKARIKGLALGECIRVGFSEPRNAKFHRKFFALLKVGFDAWEPESQRKRRKHKGVVIAKDFDAFRADITILAGFYTPVYHFNGTLELRPASIKFGKMDQQRFEQLYSAVADVLLERLLKAKGYDRAKVDEVVEQIVSFL